MSNLALFYLSTYTELLPHVKFAGPGIVCCSLNLDTGALAFESEPIPARNPSYLWLNKDRTQLYAIAEVLDHDGQEDGCLQVYTIDQKTIQAQQVISSHGTGPAYCRGDQSEQFLLCVNYLAGSVHSFPIQADGSLAGPVSSDTLSGSGPNKARQEGPHPHCIITNPQNTRAYLTELGTDQWISYRFDAQNGSFEMLEAERFKFAPNSGPRHAWFHPDGTHLFITLELSSQLAVLKVREGSAPELIGICATTQYDTAVNHPSEHAVTQDGKHIYVANRGQDSIGILEFDTTDQTLQQIGETPCGGKTPRHIALSPDERYLLVANQDGNTVTCLQRDPNTGQISPTNSQLGIQGACFIAFR